MVLSVSLGLAEQVGEIARRAGRVVMDVYNSDFEVSAKDDTSPVTEADTKAEQLIFRAIREGITAEYPLVGEEAVSSGQIPVVGGSPFWLIDPLDGTKEFVSRNGEFTVNIALIENGVPVLGVVHLPVKDDTYIATKTGAFAQYAGTGGAVQISCRQAPETDLIAIASKSHLTPETEAYLSKLPVGATSNAGSSLKFCRVAEGAADVYPRFGPTMEWDTAAGHAILLYAGGTVTTPEGPALTYGKPGFRNPNFIACGPGVPTVAV